MRVRSLLAFAAAEIDALAGELGSRGPAQLDEERHVSKDETTSISEDGVCT